MSVYKDLMVDLETLGTMPGSVILSIGAQVFNPFTGEIGPEFYIEINTESCKRVGLLVDPDTENWWSQQKPEARAVVTRCATGGVPLDQALLAFNKFIMEKAAGKLTCVWGNGADFDNPILGMAYKFCGLRPAWGTFNNRCFRTLKSLFPIVVAPPRIGTYHNALDDAKTQVEHALKIFAYCAGTTPKAVGKMTPLPNAPAAPIVPTKAAPEDAHDDDDEDLIG